MAQCYIPNPGAKLIARAKAESKAIIFGSVRMTTKYENSVDELVQKSPEWFGDNVGSVIGCQSHISVGDESRVCDSKLAILCNDNSKPWKSVGVYAHLEGETHEVLIACESIQNGDYKGTTMIEMPVSLDGVVEDFGDIGGEGEIASDVSGLETRMGAAERALAKEQGNVYAVQWESIEVETVPTLHVKWCEPGADSTWSEPVAAASAELSIDGMTVNFDSNGKLASAAFADAENDLIDISILDPTGALNVGQIAAISGGTYALSTAIEGVDGDMAVISVKHRDLILPAVLP